MSSFIELDPRLRPFEPVAVNSALLAQFSIPEAVLRVLDVQNLLERVIVCDVSALTLSVWGERLGTFAVRARR